MIDLIKCFRIYPKINLDWAVEEALELRVRPIVYFHKKALNVNSKRPQWESNPRPFDPKSNALIHCAMRSCLCKWDVYYLYNNYRSCLFVFSPDNRIRCHNTPYSLMTQNEGNMLTFYIYLHSFYSSFFGV